MTTPPRWEWDPSIGWVDRSIELAYLAAAEQIREVVAAELTESSDNPD